VSPLRDAFRRAGELSEQRRDTLHRRVEALLGGFDLDAVIGGTEGVGREERGLL